MTAIQGEITSEGLWRHASAKKPGVVLFDVIQFEPLSVLYARARKLNVGTDAPPQLYVTGYGKAHHTVAWLPENDRRHFATVLRELVDAFRATHCGESEDYVAGSRVMCGAAFPGPRPYYYWVVAGDLHEKHLLSNLALSTNES